MASKIADRASRAGALLRNRGVLAVIFGIMKLKPLSGKM
jgi:hypothetical protein